jgi:hypothetical protein
MTTEQAFQNIVACVMRCQKGGLLELHEAVATNDALMVLRDKLGLTPPQQVAPVVAEQAQA